MNMKKLLLPFLLILGFILSGCSDEGTSAEEDYPIEGVQAGIVSQDYYDSYLRFQVKSGNFSNQIKLMNLENQRKLPTTDEEFAKLEGFSEVIREYNSFSESFEATPITDADKEINNVLIKVQKKYGEYGLSFGLSYMGLGDPNMYKLWEQTRDELDVLLYELEELEVKHLISIY